MNPINANEFETAAQHKLNKSIYDYIASGACDEYTLKRNTGSFEHIQIIPRLFGRPVLWALACHSVDGVKNLFDIYRTELMETMTLCGCSTIEDITRYGHDMMRCSK